MNTQQRSKMGAPARRQKPGVLVTKTNLYKEYLSPLLPIQPDENKRNIIDALSASIKP